MSKSHPFSRFKLLVSPYLTARKELFFLVLRVAVFASFGGFLLSFLLSEFSKRLLAHNLSSFENLLFGFFVSILGYYCFAWIIRQTGAAKLRAHAWSFFHRRYLPMVLSLENNYAETLGSGRIFSIIDKWGQSWVSALGVLVEQTTKIFVISVPTIILLARQGWNVVLMTLWIMGASMLFVVFMQRRINTFKTVRARAVLEYDRRLIKAFHSRFEILQSQALEQELLVLDDRIDAYRKPYQSQIWIQILTYQWVRVLSYFILWGVYWILGHEYLSGTIPLDSVILMASLVGVTSTMLFDMTNAYMDFSDGIIQIESLWDKIEDAPKTPNIFSGKDFKYTAGTIRFEAVDFRYTEGSTVLNNFSYTFESGKKYALIGQSGGGKTTIMKLACGYLRPTGGSVSVDEQDLTEVNLSTFYSHVGYLTQDPQIFDGTIRENLLHWAQSGATDERLEHAIREAEADFVYRFPNGLDTEIGERGVKLSGGQKQRLAIAKIFLKNPEIILLDEPTSALDSTSEEAITIAFERLFRWKTVIIVAHRLKTVQQVDTILAIEDGRVVESGTHGELMELGWVYARMLEAQIHF